MRLVILSNLTVGLGGIKRSGRVGGVRNEVPIGFEADLDLMMQKVIVGGAKYGLEMFVCGISRPISSIYRIFLSEAASGGKGMGSAPEHHHQRGYVSTKTGHMGNGIGSLTVDLFSGAFKDTHGVWWMD